MKKSLFSLVFALVVLAEAPAAWAAPGNLDPAFAAVPNAERHGRLARLNDTGEIEAGFPAGTGFNGNVLAMVRQPDGKFVVGGEFTFFNGIIRNRIARLNADGSLDTTFNPGISFNASVSALVLDGTDIVVGGRFTEFNGVSRRRIARLNGDGSLDVAVSNQGSASVSVLLGDGKAGFAAETRYAVGDSPGSLIVTDINADGRLDLVVTNIGADSISFLVGRGDGTFVATVIDTEDD